MKHDARVLANLGGGRDVRAARRVLFVRESGRKTGAGFDPDFDLRFFQQIDDFGDDGNAPFGGKGFFNDTDDQRQLESGPQVHHSVFDEGLTSPLMAYFLALFRRLVLGCGLFDMPIKKICESFEVASCATVRAIDFCYEGVQLLPPHESDRSASKEMPKCQEFTQHLHQRC